MKYKERDELVASLRELADFIETDGIALPRILIYARGYANVYNHDADWTVNSDKTKARMRKIAIAMAPVKKDYVGESFNLKRRFGTIRVEVSASRGAVCVAKVIGKKEVPKYRKYGTELVDDVEWYCGDPLLAAD
jgi:hypothetical protein